MISITFQLLKMNYTFLEQVKPQGSAPFVVTPLDSVQLNADSTYTLECIITGDPEPKVTWFKDNVDIEAMPEPIRLTYKQSKFMNVRQLTIGNTNPDWHSGAYTCRARNEYGEADCSCGILVRSKLGEGSRGLESVWETKRDGSMKCPK